MPHLVAEWADVVRAEWPEATDEEVERVVRIARNVTAGYTDGKFTHPLVSTVREIAREERRGIRRREP